MVVIDVVAGNCTVVCDVTYFAMLRNLPLTCSLFPPPLEHNLPSPLFFMFPQQLLRHHCVIVVLL